MCGRISYSIDRAELLATYSWLKDAPGEVARWGMDGRKGGLFNLRSETAATKPYYHRLLLGQRVVVPASHFYEWRAVGVRRLPVAISREDGKVLNLAGVLGPWEDRPATTILTTVPNADVAALHNRMPVVLNDNDAATWVLEELSLQQVAEFLKPCPDGWLRLAAASPMARAVASGSSTPTTPIFIVITAALLAAARLRLP
jgi:putative SOS response-associated peptidase YedK